MSDISSQEFLGDEYGKLNGGNTDLEGGEIEIQNTALEVQTQVDTTIKNGSLSLNKAATEKFGLGDTLYQDGAETYTSYINR